MPVVALSVLKGPKWQQVQLWGQRGPNSCRKKGIQRVDLSSRHAPNDTELCELLTSPPGAISYVVFAASSYLDIPGSAPAISRTTDLCNPGCPDDIRGILPLDIGGHHTLACSFMLP
ncbi:uncharacterized protein FRV6_13054 [Fusarium oxysporum]|uniref:Uncharacterized protein n=1 Tax=Fusarium oxysporum TaxID=5507 RepID=A0A2H3U0A0_FUSOX|nr:uncharacterized protein FRV6_13054 [Fusarium oxysporum]